MVNAENINKIIEAIRDEDNFFNMHDYAVDPHLKFYLQQYDIDVTAECGTPACICGWANHLAGNPLDTEIGAAAFLGIDLSAASELFIPIYKSKKSIAQITREDAIATLEHLRDTGEVRW